MQLKGTITRIFKTEQVKDTFKKRLCWIAIEDGQIAVIQFTQDKCAELNKFEEGDIVEVEFAIRGKEYPAGKVWNNLQAVQIVKVGEVTKTDTIPF